MKVVVAADHAGYALKQLLVADLHAAGHEVTDVGVHAADVPVDYPDYAQLACDVVRYGQAQRAVLVCGSGVGVSVVANKFPGIRAGLCHDPYSARQGVEHDDMNVLCLGARVIGPELAREVVRAFLAARFSDEERHRRRLEKLWAIERRLYREEAVADLPTTSKPRG
ncbi:MAG: ribose-5-phosphate isomerase [Candidatus Tectimicrobiota bacterium]|nr:MAG: ribose-5-phosphate isomerase [Candidatus Tectomicrobia bacterium]